jgi:branched-chain amino acid transport system substrate-binding protein
MKRRLGLGLTISILLSLILGACGGATPQAATQAPAATEPPEEKVLRVGLEGPFTGPNARVGEEFFDAATMAFDKVNWKIGDYTVELVKIDDESDPEKATRAYEEAIVRDKIQVGLINWHSSVAVALMEVVAKYKIPHFFGFGATELVNEKYQSDPEKYSYWMGKTWPMPAKLSIAYVETIQDAMELGLWDPPSRKAAIFGEDTDWGRSFGAALRDQLIDAGWEITSEDYFALGEVEFYPLLNKWKSAGVSLIGGTSTGATSYAALIKQSREVELPVLIVADGLGWIGEWYELTGDASNFVLDQIPQWTTPEARAFRDDFETRFGITPSPSAGGQAYDMTNFFIKLANETLTAFGELTSASLYQMGQDKLWQGELVFTRADGAIIHEQYKYTPESIPDPVVGLGNYIFPVIQYTGGEGKMVWPDVWQEAELQIPDWAK